MDVLVQSINALLARSGMRQADLAGVLGVSRNAVSLWCRGLTDPSVEDLPRIAAALGVTAADLLRPETARGSALVTIPVPLVAVSAPHDVIGSVDIPVAYGRCPERIAVSVTGRCIAVCVPVGWRSDEEPEYGRVLLERSGVDGSRYELGWGHRDADGRCDLAALADHSPLTESDRVVARVELTIGSLDGLSI